jgi:CRP/FNR family cyclic AMP-dependent transcriptional regulator
MATTPRRPMVNLLGRVPLFQGCTHVDLSRVAALSEERIYREGQVIVKAGDPGRAFYVITHGRAKVVRGKTPGGKKEAELGRGEFFGELSLLDGDARTRTVVAETPLETVRIERTEFRKLLRKEPDLAIRLLEGMAKRTRKILEPKPL